MAKIETVENVLEFLCSVKPGAALPHNAVEAYALVLEPLPDEAVKQAAMALAREPGDFLPSAGAIYDRAADLVDPEPDAAEAWNLVVRHSRHASRGADNPVALPARAASALEAIGGDAGWLEDEMPFRKKEFLERYEAERREWKRSGLQDPGRLLADGR